MKTTQTALLIVATLFLLLLAGKGPAASTDNAEHLQPLTSWDLTSAAAKERGVPIIVLVEQRHCAFCQRLKRDLFRPLANDPAYRERAIFVSVLTDIDAELVKRDGVEMSGFDFADQHQANTTPTVLFFDFAANELEKRIVGFVPEDSYTETFKQKIENAIAAAKPKS